MPLGFVGLGVMGTPMAGHLVRAGHRVLGWSRSGRTHAVAAASGVQPSTRLQDVFDACATIILMLANDEAIDSVLERHNSAFASRVQDRLVINMGTSSAAYSQALGEQIRAAGGRYVEAPVSGSRLQAESAQLVIMLAGNEADVAQASQLLAPLGRQCVACGQVPSALRMTLAVNLYLITLVTGLAEAVHFAGVHGIDLQRFADVLNAGPMASEVSRIKLDKMIRQDFAVQASITDVRKNSGLVAAAAREAGMQAPLIDASDALFAQAQQMGLGAQDMAAVLQAIRGGPPASGQA